MPDIKIEEARIQALKMRLSQQKAMGKNVAALPKGAPNRALVGKPGQTRGLMKKSTLGGTQKSRETSQSENRMAFTGANNREQTRQVFGLPNGLPGALGDDDDILSGVRRSEGQVTLSHYNNPLGTINSLVDSNQQPNGEENRTFKSPAPQDIGNANNMGRNPRLSTVKDQSNDSFLQNFE